MTEAAGTETCSTASAESDNSTFQIAHFKTVLAAWNEVKHRGRLECQQRQRNAQPVTA